MEVYLIPISNKVAKINFENTIKNSIKKDTIKDFYKNNKSEYKIWGLKNGAINSRTWNKIKKGDMVIFVEKESITKTKVTDKLYSKDLSKKIWPSDMTWELIFFVDYINSEKISKKTFLQNLGYSEKDRLMGNRRVTENYNNYTNKIKEVKEVKKVKKEITFKECVVRKIKRDPNIVKKIKEMNNWKCQACSFTFMKEDGTNYVEAAHINQLSKSHDDSLENLLALCANCHKMLDLGCKKVKNEILRKCGLSELK